MRTIKVNLKSKMTPKSSPFQKVEYVLEKDETYTLYTCDEEQARIIGASFDQKAKCFIARRKSQPVGREYRVNYADPSDLKLLRQEYARYRKMQDAIDAVITAAEAQEKLLLSILAKKGLNLKPGKPHDRQLLGSAEYRLHNRLSVFQTINEDFAEEVAAKIPEVAKCFKKKTVVALDKAELLKLLPSLPAKVRYGLLRIEVDPSFHEEHLSKAECEQCGGKIEADGRCKNCGKQHAAPMQSTTRKPRRTRYGRRRVA